MKILLLSNGRTTDENIRKQLLDFNKRLSHYIDFNHLEIPNVKNSNNLNSSQLKQKEGDMINKYILKGDYIILLDENGNSINLVRSIAVESRVISKVSHPLVNAPPPEIPANKTFIAPQSLLSSYAI